MKVCVLDGCSLLEVGGKRSGLVCEFVSWKCWHVFQSLGC